MADTVTSKIIITGTHRVAMVFTNISDGTGETNVVKVNRSSLLVNGGFPPNKIAIEWAQYSIQGFEAVKISWDNTSGGADETALIIGGEGYQDFRDISNLVPIDSPSDLTSAEGDILFSIVGTPATNDTYTITLSMELS